MNFNEKNLRVTIINFKNRQFDKITIKNYKTIEYLINILILSLEE